MIKINISFEKPIIRRRVLHWIIVTAFIALFTTGLIIYTPQFSALASGGATRVIHKIAAVTLLSAPIIYAIFKRGVARQWFREATVWRKIESDDAHFTNPWRRKHKLLITIGFILIAITGIIQWFLKDTVGAGIFNISLFIHDILFFSAIVALLYHIYFEFYWWLWRKRYCRWCSAALCADACPVSAVTSTRDGTIVRDSQKCNNCRLCMQDCQRKAYYRKTVQPNKPAGSLHPSPQSH
jgi:ferredoxin